MSKYDNLLSIGAILLVALLLYKLFPFNRENFELINNGSFNQCSDISSFINKKGYRLHKKGIGIQLLCKQIT